MSVSLKIKGNKYSNQGVGADLIAIGDPKFVVLDQSYTTSGIMSDFVIVRHYPDKSVYTMASTNVISHESTRQGSLYISVSLPKGEHITGIYSMLYELSQAYKNSYMTFDGRFYHFTNAQEQPQLFVAILSRYPVVKYPYRTVRSSDDPNSVAYLYLTPAEIGQLLSDPMRPQFAQYGQIVLLPVSNPEEFTSTFQIPVKIVRPYTIILNGINTGNTVTDLSQPISVSIPETEKTEGAHLQFMYETAREGKVSGVEVNDLTQSISIRLRGKLKPELPPPPRQKQKQRPWLMFAAGVFAALLIVGGAAYFLGVFDTEKEENQPAETAAGLPQPSPDTDNMESESDTSDTSDNSGDPGNDDAAQQSGEEQTPKTIPADNNNQQAKNSGNTNTPPSVVEQPVAADPYSTLPDELKALSTQLDAKQLTDTRLNEIKREIDDKHPGTARQRELVKNQIAVIEKFTAYCANPSGGGDESVTADKIKTELDKIARLARQNHLTDFANRLTNLANTSKDLTVWISKRHSDIRKHKPILP